jgi:pimeloyl-ACP methyl ester carboxylesterase
MPAELVRVTTEDQLFLDGAWYRPATPASATYPIDACLLVHGTGSNFYAPGVLESFAVQAHSVGIAALRINTRGHDGICTIPGDKCAIRGGATYEHVADCVVDLHAWLDFLSSHGYSRVALVGHSMGGVKSAYTLSHRFHPLVQALVMISSPRFNHAWYVGHPSATAFREAFQRAQLAVVEGRPEELIPMTQPMPFLATAAGILDKYGPEDHYDWSRLLPSVPCPVLYVLGTESPRQSLGFDGVPMVLAELAHQHAHIQFTVVEGANTNYSGQPTVPFDRAWDWLQTLPRLGENP